MFSVDDGGTMSDAPARHSVRTVTPDMPDHKVLRSGEELQEMARRLSKFYGGGCHSCLLDSLSLGKGNNAIRLHVERSFTAWLGALARVAQDAGLSPATARRRAEESLIGIQGALVLARASGETKPFARVLQNLPERLTIDSKKPKPKNKRSNKS